MMGVTPLRLLFITIKSSQSMNKRSSSTTTKTILDIASFWGTTAAPLKEQQDNMTYILSSTLFLLLI